MQFNKYFNPAYSSLRTLAEMHRTITDNDTGLKVLVSGNAPKATIEYATEYSLATNRSLIAEVSLRYMEEMYIQIIPGPRFARTIRWETPKAISTG